MAKAGDDVGTTVGYHKLLNGSDSTDTTGYHWAILDGPHDGATITDEDQAIATFAPRKPGSYTIQLTVTGADGATSKDSLTATVGPFIPRIIGDATTRASTSILLDGTKSVLPLDDVTTTYEWSMTPSADSFLRPDPATQDAKTTFLPGKPGTYMVTLRVTSTRNDGATISASTTHTVTVTPSDAVGGAEDRRYWAELQITSTREALKNVRAAASKWDAAITGLLGLFATVTFLTGPAALKDVTSPDIARLGLVIIVVAFGLAFAARLAVADVDAGIPTHSNIRSAYKYRDAILDTAKREGRRLEQARRYALLAALLVGAGSLVIAYASLTKGPSAPTQALVRTASGTFCGELSTTADGAVSVAGEPIERANEVTIVTSCGSAPEAAATPDEPKKIPAWLVGVLGAGGLIAGIFASRAALDRTSRVLVLVALALGGPFIAQLSYTQALDVGLLDELDAYGALLAPIAGLVVGAALFWKVPDIPVGRNFRR